MERHAPTQNAHCHVPVALLLIRPLFHTACEAIPARGFHTAPIRDHRCKNSALLEPRARLFWLIRRKRVAAGSSPPLSAPGQGLRPNPDEPPGDDCRVPLSLANSSFCILYSRRCWALAARPRAVMLMKQCGGTFSRKKGLCGGGGETGVLLDAHLFTSAHPRSPVKGALRTTWAVRSAMCRRACARLRSPNGSGRPQRCPGCVCVQRPMIEHHIVGLLFGDELPPKRTSAFGNGIQCHWVLVCHLCSISRIGAALSFSRLFHIVLSREAMDTPHDAYDCTQ